MTNRFKKGALALVFALMFCGVQLCFGEAKAQSFCPGAVNATNGPQPGVGQSAGTCTNGVTGAFSGAALASQSLGNLASTTTQLETTTANRALAGRRSEAAEVCGPDENKVDGVCVKRRPTPVVTRPAPTRPVVATKPKYVTKSVKVKTKEGEVRVVRRRQRVPSTVVAEPAPVYVPQQGVVYDGTRHGVWVQGYGDYERRTGSAQTSFVCCTVAPQAPIPVTLNVSSDTTTFGVVAGIDWAARGLFGPNDGVVVGFLTGYMHSTVDINTNIISGAPALAASGSSHSRSQLDGPSVGAYASYYNGAFSNDFLIKNDFLSLNETFSESLGFGLCTCTLPGPGAIAGGGGGPAGGVLAFTAPNAGTLGTRLNQITLSDIVNYRIPLTATTFYEPTGGVIYTKSLYDSSAALLGLRDGDSVRLQAGVRYGIVSLLGGRPLTAVLTAQAFDDVLVRGNFIQGGVFGANGNILRDQGRLQGQGIASLNYDFGSGYVSFVQADVRGGDRISGVGGKGGIRYQW